jgi:hypothetical protein
MIVSHAQSSIKRLEDPKHVPNQISFSYDRNNAAVFKFVIEGEEYDIHVKVPHWSIQNIQGMHF